MYSFVKGMLNATLVTIVVAVVGGMCSVLQAADSEQTQTIKGIVQNQDLRRVPQAVIEVKNQEGDMVSSGVSNDAGEFRLASPRAVPTPSVPCRRPIEANMSCSRLAKSR
ncbi:MAG: carboxypeptidase regulatory-like domain-containing protein [Nitrospira sp.]|nr:carboxypeptidase regulatory-like domain-containing protein [Nitrospira sp.]